MSTALVDRSGTVTSGTVSQQIMGDNSGRTYIIIQNIHDTEDLWIAFGQAAAIDDPSSLRIVAKAAYCDDGATCASSAVQITALTTGHKFTAYEG